MKFFVTVFVGLLAISAIQARSVFENTIDFDKLVSQLNETEEAEDSVHDQFINCVQVGVDDVVRRNHELQEWGLEWDELRAYVQTRLAECEGDQECIDNTREVFLTRLGELLERLRELDYGYRYIAEVLLVVAYCSTDYPTNPEMFVNGIPQFAEEWKAAQKSSAIPDFPEDDDFELDDELDIPEDDSQEDEEDISVEEDFELDDKLDIPEDDSQEDEEDISVDEDFDLDNELDIPEDDSQEDEEDFSLDEDFDLDNELDIPEDDSQEDEEDLSVDEDVELDDELHIPEDDSQENEEDFSLDDDSKLVAL